MRIRLALVALMMMSLTGCLPSAETAAYAIAKEMCTCRYVMNRTISQCESAVHQLFWVGSAKYDDVGKSVVGHATIGSSAVAQFRWRSERFGCEAVSP